MRNLQMLKKVGLIFVLLSAFSQLVKAQTANDFVTPLVDGERALQFLVNTNDVRAERLTVNVFYSDNAIKLNNLNDSSLSGGRAVLRLDRYSANVVYVQFLFPHSDFPTDPNRFLYRKYIAANSEIVRYSDLESQMSQQLNNTGLADFRRKPSLIDVNPRKYDKGVCVYYRVRITINSRDVFTSETASFRMPDTYNIAIAGDSYGSGEGAPHRTFNPVGDNSNMWTHDDCHRSNKSGFVRGVKKFIGDNPDVAVDYIHVACSGATVGKLITEAQQQSKFYDFRSPHRIQFDLIQKFLDDENHRELHLLLLSIGGNNLGFADIVINYMIMPTNAATDESLPGNIQSQINSLKDSYDALNEQIQNRFPTAAVSISTYPNPTRGPYGFCGTAANPAQLALRYPCCPSEVNQTTNPVAEYQFISEQFVRPMNSTVRESATEHGWSVIEVESRMGIHGLCNCDDPYVNTLGVSFLVQGNPSGTVHPNSNGYREIYRDPVASNINNAFDNFWTLRTGGIFLAKLLGIESETIPVACPSSELLDYLLSHIFLTTRVPRFQHIFDLRDFARDANVVDAISKNDLVRLRTLPAFKTLLSRRAEAMSIVERTFRKPQKSPANAAVSKLPESVVRQRTRAREFLRSTEFQKMRTKAMSESVRPQLQIDKDETDNLFNRPRKP